MMEYIKENWPKQKMIKLGKTKSVIRAYYQENGLFIKETEDGEKFVVTLNEQHQEIVVGKVK